MTKYKEYLRAKGIKLECDFDYLPYDYIEAVKTRVLDDCVAVIDYYNCTSPEYMVYDRHGGHGWYDLYDDGDLIERFNISSEYVDWLYGAGFSDYAFLFKWLKRMYRNDPEVRIAFKHMKAGIMKEEVFYRWLAKQYKKVLSLYGVC